MVLWILFFCVCAVCLVNRKIKSQHQGYLLQDELVVRGEEKRIVLDEDTMVAESVDLGGGLLGGAVIMDEIMMIAEWVLWVTWTEGVAVVLGGGGEGGDKLFYWEGEKIIVTRVASHLELTHAVQKWYHYCFTKTMVAGWDHREQAEAEDHEPPDRPAEGGDPDKGGSPGQGATGASTCGEGEGNSQSE